jgi:hypothetical protein
MDTLVRLFRPLVTLGVDGATANARAVCEARRAENLLVDAVAARLATAARARLPRVAA